MPGSALSPLYTNDTARYLATKIINNATFSGTVTSPAVDMSIYRHFIVTYKTGTITSNPTMTITLQIQDANGNWISDPDYVSTAITTNTSGIAFKGYLEATGIIRVVCNYSGSGSFATTTVALETKS